MRHPLWLTAFVTMLLPSLATGQTALFATQKSATSSAPGGDSGSGKASTVTPDLFTGSFSYSVPIEVPPGRRGMQPNLVLRYLSSAGNGWLGMGWTLEPGAIERSTRTGVRYDREDYVLKDAGGATDLQQMPSGNFRPIIERDFVRIKKLVAADGEPYFEVTDRDGQKYTYGSNATSRQSDPRPVQPGQQRHVFRWSIDRIEDTHGNYIAFSYSRDPSAEIASQGAIYLERVDYGGAAGRATTAYVRFYREQRLNDATLSYATGFPVRVSYRLRAIEVGAGGTLVRAYELAYLPEGPSTKRAILGSIQQFGSDAQITTQSAPDGTITHVTITGPSSLPPVSMTYNAGGVLGDWSVPGPYRNIGGSLDEIQQDVGRAFTGDFDGDGYMDVAFISGWNGNWAMAVYYGSQYGLATVADAGPVIGVAGDHDGLITGEFRIKVGDFNGDGRTDIAVLQGWDQAYPGPPMIIFYAMKQRRGFDLGVPGPPVNTAGDHEGARIDASRVLVGDFNGDGLSDFLIAEGWDSDGLNNGQPFPMRLYLANPNGGFDPPRDGPPLYLPGDHAGNWDVIARLKLGDFNGDGKTDVAYVEGWQTWSQGGLPMTIYYANETGTGFNARPGPVRSVGGDHDAVRIDAGRIIVGDFNGDGKSDIIAADGWDGGPFAMNLYLSNGDGFDDPRAVGPALSYPGDYDGMYDVIARFKLGDFNGDGKTDIAIVEGWSGATKMSIYLSTGEGFQSRMDGPTRIMTASHEGVRLDAARVLVADFNGDGKADIAAIEGSQCVIFGPCYPAGIYAMSTYLSPAMPPDLLQSISNGRGTTASMAYASSSSYANTRLAFAVQTLRSMETSIADFNGSAISSSASFTYAGGYYHQGEHDFRGFSYAKVAESVNHGETAVLVKETWFHQGNGTSLAPDDASAPTGYAKGRPWRSVVSDGSAPSNYTEALTTYWPDAAGVGSWVDANGEPPWFTPVRRVESTRYEANVAAVRTATEYTVYDDFGNIKEEIQYGDLDTPENVRRIVRTYDPNADAWIVSLPVTEDVYHDTTHLAGKWFYYDGTPLASVTASEAERRSLCSDVPANVSTNTRPTRGNLTRVASWASYCGPDGTCTEGPKPEGRTGYDALGNKVCVSNSQGPASAVQYAVTTIQYDGSATYPTVATNALIQPVQTVYYGVDGVPLDNGIYGAPKQTLDPNGVSISAFRYDKVGRLLRETVPGATAAAGNALDWSVTVYSYGTYAADGREYIRTDLYSRPTGSTETLDPASVVSWSEIYFDGAGREVWRRRPGADGKVTVEARTFDQRGAVVAESMPFFETGDTRRDITKTYDGFGRVTSITSPAGTIGMCYSGKTTVRIDENGHRKRETRDANSRLVKVEEFLGTYTLPCTADSPAPYAVTQYSYDPRGLLRFVTDAKGNKTEIRYDSLGLKRYLHDPDMGLLYYAYDMAGNLSWRQDPQLRDYAAPPGLEKAVTLEYDLLGRLKRKAYPDGTDVSYDYDLEFETGGTTLPPSAPIGHLTRLRDSSGSETRRWDEAGRLVRFTKNINSSGSFSVEKSYDVRGRTRRLTYPTPNDTVLYEYDAGDNLLSASPYVTYSGYNAMGQPGLVAYGNGITTQMTYYDTHRRLKSITIGSPPDYCGPGTGVRTYASMTLGYDNVGNINSIGNIASSCDSAQSDRSGTFQYDELDRLQGVSNSILAEDYSYDTIGNLTKKGNRTFEYSTVAHSLDGTTGDKPHAVMTSKPIADTGWATSYDLENRPISVIRNGVATTLVYDGDGDRVKKVTPQGTTTYIKGFEECAGATCGIYIVAQGMIVALKTGSDVKYFHQNHIGSTVLVTSSAGAPLEDIAYYAYGDSALDSGSVWMSHKFTGQELDRETDLYYYSARYYAPRIGRFVSPDSVAPELANPQLLNRYSYARNNPVRYRDPSGHIAVIDDILVGAAIGAVVGGTVAAATNEDIGKGMEMGAVSGSFAGLGSGIVAAAGLKGTLAAVGIYTAAGAASGATTAMMSQASPGRGALVGAGMAFAMAALPTPKFQPFGPSATVPAASVANRVFNASLSGAMWGGGYAAMTGGDVRKGAIRGATTWAVGSSINMLIGHAIGQIATGGADPTFEDGVYRYKARIGGWQGMSIGNVIIGTDADLDRPNYDHGRTGTARAIDHERAHMPQETLLGPAYLPAVGISYLVGEALGGSIDPSHTNSQFDNGSWIEIPDCY